MELEIQTETGRSFGSQWFDKYSFFLILAVVFLLPLFFLSGPSIFLSKAFLYGIITLLILAFWIIKKLKDTEITIPIGLLPLASVIIPAVFLLSSLFAISDSGASFFGARLEVGTGLSIVLAFILLSFTAVLLKTKDRVFAFYVAFFSSSLVLGLFQLLRLFFGPDFLSFGIFNTINSTLLGRWNELGIFFGLVAILSLFSLEAMSLKRSFKLAWSTVLGLALFLMGSVNFSYAWVILGIYALLSLVYIIVLKTRNSSADAELSDVTEQKKNALQVAMPILKRTPKVSLIVFIVALLFIFPAIPGFFTSLLPQPAQQGINSVMSHYRINQLEVSPSYAYTWDIFIATAKSDPIFGVGPMQFSRQWLTFKPNDVNLSQFWVTDFVYGIGLIPTFAVTTGTVGILAWIFFIGCLLYAGFQEIFLKKRDAFSQYLITTSFFAAIYLWIFQIIYVPSEALFLLTFLFTGVFLACLHQEGGIKTRTYVYGSNPRISFISVLLLVIILLATVSVAFFTTERVLAANAFNKALQAGNVEGDLTRAEVYIKKAIGLDPRDEYYRALADLGVVRVNAVLSQQGVTREQISAQASPSVALALESAQNAIKADKDNYQNWMSLGRLYEGVMPFGYDKAYESAKATYQEALKLNPKNPAIVLALARLEGARNNLSGAKELVFQSLNIKKNYSEGIYYLAQIQVAEGNVKDAIQSVSAVAFLNPNEPSVFFQLGFLLYSDKNYKDTITALEKAVQLNNQYSNARYFLGLSYSKLGRRADAVAQFVEIAKLNPNNQEVKNILANLRAGRDPLANPKPPADSKPEKRKKLPVSDSDI